MAMTFRVEAFIIPSLNREAPSENIIDDVKVAKLLRNSSSPRKLECINEDSEYSDNSILERSSENILGDEKNLGDVEEKQSPSQQQIPKLNNENEEWYCHSDNFTHEKFSKNSRKDEKIVGDCEQEQPTNQKQYSAFQEDLNDPIYDVPLSCRAKSMQNVKKLSESVEILDHTRATDFTRLGINFPQSDDDSDPGGTRDEPIYDVPYFYGRNAREPLNFIKKLETGEFVSLEKSERFRGPKIPPRPPMRSSSLMSIDERGETPDDCGNQFCQHGLKNGCTATTQRPQEVTEEIFEVNWMKRLESLRAREAVIKDKEAMLFDRERLLFKKERELRILERLIKDKLKHVELCSKRSKHTNIDSGSIDELSERSEDSRGSKQSLEKRLNSLENLESLTSFHTTSSKGSSAGRNTAAVDPGKCSSVGDDKNLPERVTGHSTIKMAAGKIVNSTNDRIGCEGVRSSVSVTANSNCDGKILTNPPISRSSLVSSNYVAPAQSAGLVHPGRGSSIGYSGHSSMRRKRKPRISYDDLDSTLSADIGDSSFVVTSRMFDPAIFKKPQAFTRTSSERRSHIEEEKVLKRLSENIFVSKNRDTKFQDYGLIDLGHKDERSEEDEKRCSYLNLEKGGHKTRERGKKDGKERPISWSEKQDEWLQRKRMAYNCTMRRTPTEHIDKENLQRKGEVKKKVSMVKKFSIFR